MEVNESMNKRYFIITLLLFFLCFPSIQVNAQEENTNSRLSVKVSDIYISERSIIKVTYANRKIGEELQVSSEDESIVRVKMGKWYEDVKNIIIIPRRAGNVTLTVTAPNQETLTLTLHVVERKQLTGAQLYEKCSEAVVEVVTYDSVRNRNVGSGFFINRNMVVTNYHVIDCANDMTIRDYNGNSYEVECIYDYNEKFDLAVLGVKEESDCALICNFSNVETGLEVYTIGSPALLSGSISEGMVSKAYRFQDGVTYHQNTACISQSSGGGPLLNIYGEVIGVNTMYMIGPQNVYFAVDINYLNLLDYSKKAPIETLYQENEGKIKPINIYVTLSN